MAFHAAAAVPRYPVASAVVRGPRSVQDAAHRLLQRTAYLWASSPGGLRIEPDSPPCLVGLPGAARISASAPRHASCA